MNLRPLILDDTAKHKAADIMAYGQDHPYVMGRDKWVPGDDHRYVGHFNTFRAVFTFTRRGDDTFRHLTVSVPGRGFPNPIACWSLAELFGFTGWDGKSAKTPDDWQFGLKDQEHCIVVVQKVAA